MRRGFSLLEVVVVLAITITVLFTALPIVVALLREQKGLAAEVLRGDTLPFLHGRIDRDLGNARDMAFDQDPETGGILISLAPRAEKAPRIVWNFAGTRIERREVPADGTDGPPPHTWTVAGALSVDPIELYEGRLGLRWFPASGPAELLVFEAPRAGEELN